MPRLSLSAVCLLGAFAIGLCTTKHRQVLAKPLPTGDAIHTCDEFYQGWLAYLDREIEIFRKHTPVSSDQHAAAIKLLSDAHRWRLGYSYEGSLESLGRQADQLAIAKEPKLGGPFYDPLIMTWAAEIYRSLGFHRDASRCRLAAETNFRNSSYPPTVQLRIVRLAGEIDGQSGRSAVASVLKRLTIASTAITSEKIDAQDQRYIWQLCAELLLAYPAPELEPFAKAVESSENVPPWLAHMILGAHQRRLAWYHRGEGWSDIGKRAGAESFDKLSRAAREHFLKAYEAEPKWPESCCEMISVAAGGFDDLETRDWFDRAVAAEFDYMPAYRHYLYVLRPRWGGTHTQMFAFGRECLATRRFDTNVPQMIIPALIDINEEIVAAGEDPIWDRKGVYPAIKKCYRGNLDKPPPAATKRVGLSHAKAATELLCYASLAQQHQDIRDLFEKYRDQLDLAILYANNINPAIEEPWARALTGPLKQDVVALLNILNTPGVRSSQPLLEKAIAQAKASLGKNQDPLVAPYFERWLRQLGQTIDFNAGKTVDLHFPADGTSFTPTQTGWSIVDERTLKSAGTKTKFPSKVVVDGMFEPPYEVEVEITHNPESIMANSGIELGSGGKKLSRRPIEFTIVPRERKLRVKSSGDVEYTVPFASASQVRIGVQAWPDYWHLVVDGKSVMAGADDYFEPIRTFNLTCIEEARFSNLRIRKLTPGTFPSNADPEGQLAFFSELLKQFPDSGAALFERGKLYVRLEQYDKALIDLLASWEAMENVPERSATLAKCLAKAGYFGAAFSQYQTERFSADSESIRAVYLNRQEYCSRKVNAEVAWLWAAAPDKKVRNVAQALALAKQLNEESSEPDAETVMCLAAAEAANSNWAAGVHLAERAVNLADGQRQQELKAILQLYREQKPYELKPAIQVDKLVDLSEGLVAHWKFDEAEGQTAKDASPCGNHAKLYNVELNQPGAINKSFQFNGTDSFVEAPYSPTLAFEGQLSTSLWLKMDDPTESSPLIPVFFSRMILRRSLEGQQVAFALSANAKQSFSVACTRQGNDKAANGFQEVLRGSLNPPESTTWIHVASVFNGRSCRLYVNGYERSSLSGDVLPTAAKAPWTIGKGLDKSRRGFQGWIDDVRIYNRALSPVEISELYWYERDN